jgi:hypothetical protein
MPIYRDGVIIGGVEAPSWAKIVRGLVPNTILAVSATGINFRAMAAADLPLSAAITWTGKHLVKVATDATDAWQVQDKDGNIILSVDSINNLVGIGTAAPAAKLAVNGGAHIGGDTDPGDNNLLVDGTATITGALGVNGATAQPAYASGGALAAYGTGIFGLDSGANMSALHALVVKIRAALVANGIMS